MIAPADVLSRCALAAAGPLKFFMLAGGNAGEVIGIGRAGQALAAVRVRSLEQLHVRLLQSTPRKQLVRRAQHQGENAATKAGLPEGSRWTYHVRPASAAALRIHRA